MSDGCLHQNRWPSIPNNVRQGARINLGTTRITDQVMAELKGQYLSTDAELVSFLSAVLDSLSANRRSGPGSVQRLDLLNSPLYLAQDEQTQARMRFALRESDPTTRRFKSRQRLRRRDAKRAMKSQQVVNLISARNESGEGARMLSNAVISRMLRVPISHVTALHRPRPLQLTVPITRQPHNVRRVQEAISRIPP